MMARSDALRSSPIWNAGSAVEAGTIAVLSATTATVAATGIAAMTGIAAPDATGKGGAAPSGCNRATADISEHAKSRRIPAAFSRLGAGEKHRTIAGHRRFALLNDAVLTQGYFRTGSGRIAQLVEQMTLNHRVPGSSPGAPTTPSSA